MTTSAFISYSRRNTPFAERLQLDLIRAGVKAWRDESNIPLDRRFRDEIRDAIAAASHFLLLASPESADSIEVGKELAEAEAQHKPILTLRVGGLDDQLQEGWNERHFTQFHYGYDVGLKLLLAHLNAPQPAPFSLLELLRRGQGTFADAAKQLTGALPILVGDRDYLGLPVEPSAYTMTWLVAKADAVLKPPPSLAVLLRFTGPAQRPETAAEVFEFLALNGVTEDWLIYVQGPRTPVGDYDLPAESPHVWEDGVRAAAKALQSPLVKQASRCRLFMESPVALGYALGGQLLKMVNPSVYHYVRGNPLKERYQHVLGPKPG